MDGFVDLSETMSTCGASTITSDYSFEETDDTRQIDADHRTLVGQVFRPVLRDRLVPSVILNHLRFLRDKRQELLLLERSVPRRQVTDKLIDFVVATEKKSWFESFIDALHNAGYVELMSLFTRNNSTQKKETYHLFMQHCYDLLVEQASPEELLTDLFDAKVIDEDDANAIAEMICDEGSHAGMSLINCRIARHSSTWFEDLKTALRSTKKFELVKKLEKEMDPPEKDSDILLSLDEEQTSEKRSIARAESFVVANDPMPEEPEAEDNVGEVIDVRKRFELRSYQSELVDGVGDVCNSLVMAPTGCGKTLVAAEVIKRHIERKPETKVLFLVPTVALVQQQFEVLEQYLPDSCIKTISGEASSMHPLKYLLKRYDILVLTPQILVNACEIESLSSFGIGLLIFDECHHSMKEHPYSKIMALYHDLKPNAETLPRIVGLTASVGVGKARSMEDAIKYIIRLLANMDAHLVTVVVNKEELAFCVNRPQENLVYLKERNPDPFYNCIRSIMVKIETKIGQYSKEMAMAKEQLGVTVQIKPPTEKGSLLYKQWYSAFANQLIIKVENEQIHRDLVCCADYLKVYNDTLLINSDCRSLDALKYLQEKVQPLLKSKDPDRDTDNLLADFFTGEVCKLKRACDDPSNDNPKLIALKANILNGKKDNEPMRCIVFCQTREICSSLVAWAMATNGLVELKARFLTGSNAAADKKGLTSNQQNDVIKAFANGEHQLIFATNVAEEGLDIQACDNVIRYQYVTSMTARIQSRGRARKSEASFTLLASSKEAQRDEMNSIREEIQAEAIQNIMSMNKEEFKRKQLEEQRKQIYKRKMGAQGKEQEQRRERGLLREQGVDYTLLCRKCGTIATPSDHLRVIESVHHVVISDEFNDKIRIIPDPDQKSYAGWVQTEKMMCRSCGEYWGPRSRYLNQSYPVIKIEQFDILTPKGETMHIKKWKECPFYIDKYQPDMEIPDEEVD